MGSTNIFTYTINGGSLTLVESDRVQRVSIICSSGQVSVLGSAKFQGNNSQEVFLSTGQGVTLTTQNFENIITGVTINAAGGIADLIISYQ
jgi:hypothetical protein